jgi:hypothetical protein
MAQVSSFVNTSRSRLTAYLKVMEDMVSLQTEFNALGGVTFTNTFDFNAENASTYDMTQAEYTAMLTALGQVITVYQGGAASLDATRPAALYKGKV